MFKLELIEIHFDGESCVPRQEESIAWGRGEGLLQALRCFGTWEEDMASLGSHICCCAPTSPLLLSTLPLIGQQKETNVWPAYLGG